MLNSGRKKGLRMMRCDATGRRGKVFEVIGMDEVGGARVGFEN